MYLYININSIITFVLAVFISTRLISEQFAEAGWLTIFPLSSFPNSAGFDIAFHYFAIDTLMYRNLVEILRYVVTIIVMRRIIFWNVPLHILSAVKSYQNTIIPFLLSKNVCCFFWNSRFLYNFYCYLNITIYSLTFHLSYKDFLISPHPNR